MPSAESAHGDRRWFERHPVPVLLLIVCLGIAAVDLVGGLLFRTLTGQSFTAMATNPGRHLNRSYRVSSPVFHHGLVPGISMPASWGPHQYTMVTNSLGFRDETPREVELARAGRRLVLIGDSFTEGVGVSFADSFAGIVTATLRPAGIEVLNAGVNSYSPSIHYAKVRHLLEDVGLRFDELAVFLDISDAWDEAKSYVLDGERVVDRAPAGPAPSATFEQFLRRNSMLYGVPVFFRKRGESAPPSLVALNTSPKACWTFQPRARESFGDEGLRLMTAGMDRLAALLERHGVRLTLVVYPWPAQILGKDLDSLQERHWSDWCAQHGAAFVDLFPLFVTADEAVNRKNVDAYYIPSDMHWNAAGHRLVAEAFLRARR